MSDLSELTQLILDSNKAFEEFKSANDKRLDELKKGGAVPADLLAKIETISKDFGETRTKIETLEAKMRRPGLTSGDGRVFIAGREIKGYVEDETQAEHRKAFRNYLCKGIEFDRSIEQKALSISSGPDGGFAVPKVIDAMIEATIVNISPIRALAQVVQVSTPDYHRLVNIHGTASGWVGEKAARASTGTSTLEDINPPMGDLYAFPQATQQMMDDVFFNAEQWISDEVALEFARAEGAAFVNGTGIQQPRGFTTYPVAATADSSRPFGTFEYTFTGSAGAFKTTSTTVNPSDDLITVVSRLKKGYRANAVWVMNKNTLFTVMAFKDSQGRYIFNPTSAPGIEDTVLGYPIVEAEDMADYTTTNALAIAFGDFKRGYIIVDRVGTRVIRDPFSNKPYIGFYIVKREGGAALNTETIKFLKFGTS